MGISGNSLPACQSTAGLGNQVNKGRGVLGRVLLDVSGLAEGNIAEGNIGEGNIDQWSSGWSNTH